MEGTFVKFKNIRKKAVAGFLTGALLVCSVGSALAADSGYDPYDNAPETTVDVNENILSGATAAANTPVLSMLGINVTCSDNIGIMGNDSDNPLNLLVFGSSLNESADPYLANYYYYYDAYGYIGAYNADNYTAYSTNWDDGAFSLISDYAKSGPTGASNSEATVTITVDGVTKTCNPLFFYEPDVLLGSTTSSYDTGLTAYQNSTYASSDYNPLVLGGWSTGSGGYCMNDGTFASTAAMANGVYADAVAIQSYVDTLNADIEDDEDKITGRYGDIDACGATYANFAMGLYYYVQSKLANGMTAVKYCTALTVNSDGSYTISTGSGHMAQYADGLGTQVTSGTYATASDLAEAVDVVIASNLTDDQVKTLTTVGIKVITSLPDTVYGTTMQAPDNILGVPYYIAVFYGDTLGLTTADVTAYFVDNIYHVNTEDVQTVLDVMMLDIVDNGSVSTSTITHSNYTSLVNALITTGAAYYNAGNTGGYTWDSVSTVS